MRDIEKSNTVCNNTVASKTLNVTEEVKLWLVSLKLFQRETINDVLLRLRDERILYNEEITKMQDVIKQLTD